jgi:hypothetical protein
LLPYHKRPEILVGTGVPKLLPVKLDGVPAISRRRPPRESPTAVLPPMNAGWPAVLRPTGG